MTAAAAEAGPFHMDKGPAADTCSSRVRIRRPFPAAAVAHRSTGQDTPSAHCTVSGRRTTFDRRTASCPHTVAGRHTASGHRTICGRRTGAGPERDAVEGSADPFVEDSVHPAVEDSRWRLVVLVANSSRLIDISDPPRTPCPESAGLIGMFALGADRILEAAQHRLGLLGEAASGPRHREPSNVNLRHCFVEDLPSLVDNHLPCCD